MYSLNNLKGNQNQHCLVNTQFRTKYIPTHIGILHISKENLVDEHTSDIDYLAPRYSNIHIAFQPRQIPHDKYIDYHPIKH